MTIFRRQYCMHGGLLAELGNDNNNELLVCVLCGKTLLDAGMPGIVI